MKQIKSEQDRKWDIIAIITIIGLGIFQVLRCLEYPGVYLDAVNPDYLAVQILYPEVKNTNWAVAHSGFPLLGQLYHGTITVWLQLLLIGIMGQASLLTLRLANMIYVMGICWMIYLILKKINVKKALLLGTVILIMMSPQVFSFIRTQYYIKLPGTLLLLCALYCILSMEKSEKQGVFVVLSGIFSGLAFYSYFIYLFFVPAMLTFVFWKGKSNRSNCIRDILVWITGFCYGCVPYIIGYFDFIITNTALTSNVKKDIVILFTVLLIVLGFLLLIQIVKKFEDIKKVYKMYRFIGILALLVLLIVLLCIPYIYKALKPILESLNVTGTEMNVLDRIKQVVFLWKGIMSNEFSEYLMLGEQKGLVKSIYIFSFCCISVLTGGILLYHRKNILDDIKVKVTVLLFVWLLIIVYGINSLGFISRMGGQHFTPIFFLSVLIICIELDVIATMLYNRAGTYFSCMYVTLLICIGVINSGILSADLGFSGGNGLFTSQINELAESALEIKSSGKKECYVFPEWGFLCGFNYLTMNQIPIMTNIDIEELQNYISEGYSFKLCFWNEEDACNYMELLEEAKFKDLVVTTMRSSGAESAFYIITQENDKMVK